MKPPYKAKPGYHWIKLVSPEGEEWIEAEDPDPDMKSYFGVYEETLSDGTVVEHKIEYGKFNSKPQILNDTWDLCLRGKKEENTENS